MFILSNISVVEKYILLVCKTSDKPESIFRLFNFKQLFCLLNFKLKKVAIGKVMNQRLLFDRTMRESVNYIILSVSKPARFKNVLIKKRGPRLRFVKIP